jgi:hypothetical protein
MGLVHLTERKFIESLCTECHWAVTLFDRTEFDRKEANQKVFLSQKLKRPKKSANRPDPKVIFRMVFSNVLMAENVNYRNVVRNRPKTIDLNSVKMKFFK